MADPALEHGTFGLQKLNAQPNIHTIIPHSHWRFAFNKCTSSFIYKLVLGRQVLQSFRELYMYIIYKVQVTDNDNDAVAAASAAVGSSATVAAAVAVAVFCF